MAMVVHAAGESATDGPVPVGTHAVVLSVPNEESLMNLSAALGGRGVEHHLVREPDLDMQAMALALPPGPRCKLLSSLPLYPKKSK